MSSSGGLIDVFDSIREYQRETLRQFLSAKGYERAEVIFDQVKERVFIAIHREEGIDDNIANNLMEDIIASRFVFRQSVVITNSFFDDPSYTVEYTAFSDGMERRESQKWYDENIDHRYDVRGDESVGLEGGGEGGYDEVEDSHAEDDMDEDDEEEIDEVSGASPAVQLLDSGIQRVEEVRESDDPSPLTISLPNIPGDREGADDALDESLNTLTYEDLFSSYFPLEFFEESDQVTWSEQISHLLPDYLWGSVARECSSPVSLSFHDRVRELFGEVEEAFSMQRGDCCSSYGE